MNSQLYTDYKDVACTCGAFVGVCCGIAHTAMHWRGYKNLDIIHGFAQCLLYASVWIIYCGMYLDVTDGALHYTANIGALMTQFLKYYVYCYGTVAMAGVFALMTLHKRLYKAIVSGVQGFMHELSDPQPDDAASAKKVSPMTSK